MTLDLNAIFGDSPPPRRRGQPIPPKRRPKPEPPPVPRFSTRKWLGQLWDRQPLVCLIANAVLSMVVAGLGDGTGWRGFAKLYLMWSLAMPVVYVAVRPTQTVKEAKGFAILGGFLAGFFGMIPISFLLAEDIGEKRPGAIFEKASYGPESTLLDVRYRGGTVQEAAARGRVSSSSSLRRLHSVSWGRVHVSRLEYVDIYWDTWTMVNVRDSDRYLYVRLTRRAHRFSNDSPWPAVVLAGLIGGGLFLTTLAIRWAWCKHRPRSYGSWFPS